MTGHYNFYDVMWCGSGLCCIQRFACT